LGRAADVNFARANDINNFGLIVGTVSQFDNFSGRAAIWKPGDAAPTELNSLLPPDSGWTLLTAAEGVNDHGQIAGFGTKDGFTRAYVMTPYDVALSDPAKGITLLVNSSSGDYKLIDCQTGRVYEGKGEVSISGCMLKLKHREFAGIELDMEFDVCRLVGSGTYGRTQTFRRTSFVDNEQGNVPNPGVCSL